jgi:hypothetical protein
MNRGMRRQNNNNQDGGEATVDNAPLAMRVNLQVAFDAPRPSPDQLSNTIRARLGNILAAQNIAMPGLTMEGDVAVLRGVALSESQRLVMERLISLEPGVNAVRNEMTVMAPGAPTATE